MKEQEKQSSTQEDQSEGEAKVAQISNSSKSDGTKYGNYGLLHALEGEGMKESEQDKTRHTSAPVWKILSGMEAAVSIQSAYRRYVVRRWEPLKKLRQIANVREETTEVKSQIERLESGSAVDNKEKVSIGETIMNLLLKLDTIQGLHQSVRDVRKSVANELVLLQEKLDSSGSQSSMLTDQYSSTFQVVEEHPTAFGSDGDPAVSLEKVLDNSKIFEHDEASGANETVGTQEAGEVGSFTEEPFSCSTGSQDTVRSTGNEVLFEVNEESGRLHHNDEAVPPNEGSSDYEANALCLDELDGTVTAPDDSSMVSQNALADVMPLEETLVHFNMGSCEKDREAKLGAKSPEESVEEKVENDLCRMDWECDLGAAKTTHDIGMEEELVEEIHGQANSFGAVCEEDEGGTSEVGNSVTSATVEEKHVQVVSVGDVSEKEKGEIPEMGNSGTCNKVLEVDRPNDNSETQFEADITAEICDEENLSSQEPDITDTLCEDIPIFKQGDRLNDRTAEEVSVVEPDVEVEKEVIKEGPETEISGQPRQVTDESPSNQQIVPGGHITELPISESGKEEGKFESSTFLTDAPQHQDVPELLTLSSDGPVSVTAFDNKEQIDKRIMEENENLRVMVEKLLASGNEQQDIISSLSAKVTDLEKKVSKRSKTRSGKRPGLIISRGKSLTAR